MKNSVQPGNEGNKLFYLLAVGVLVLAVGVTAYFVFGGQGDGGGEERNSFSMIPIWIAVFVPLLATRNQGKVEPGTKKMLIVGVILGILVALALALFLLMN